MSHSCWHGGGPRANRGAATVLQSLLGAKILIADKGVEAQPVPPSPVRFENHALHSQTQNRKAPITCDIKI
jgi:hypothetical protein